MNFLQQALFPFFVSLGRDEMRIRLWKSFLTFVMLVVFWYSGVAVYSLYHYYQLNAYTQTTATHWTVKEINEENYVLKVDFTFASRNESFKGKDLLEIPAYRNAWAAEDGAKKNGSHAWKVWFSSNDPQYSSLQKKFPLKECLSSLILWGVMFYFIWLQAYVAKIK